MLWDKVKTYTCDPALLFEYLSEKVPIKLVLLLSNYIYYQQVLGSGNAFHLTCPIETSLDYNYLSPVGHLYPTTV